MSEAMDMSEAMETGVRPMPALAAQELAGMEKEGQPRAAAVAEQEAEAHAGELPGQTALPGAVNKL